MLHDIQKVETELTEDPENSSAEVFENLDELLEQIKRDELSDAQWMTPVQYAKLRPVYAPYIYRLLKANKIPHKICDCGRKVINVKGTDAYFTKRRKDWPYPVEEEDDE